MSTDANRGYSLKSKTHGKQCRTRWDGSFNNELSSSSTLFAHVYVLVCRAERVLTYSIQTRKCPGGQVVGAPNFRLQSTCTGFESLCRQNFSSWLYGASLHRTCHVILLWSQYDLNNVEKDVKHLIIIQILFEQQVNAEAIVLSGFLWLRECLGCSGLLCGLIQQMTDWWYFLNFPRKQGLTFHANCLHWRQFAWNVETCFLGKIRKNI